MQKNMLDSEIKQLVAWSRQGKTHETLQVKLTHRAKQRKFQ